MARPALGRRLWGPAEPRGMDWFLLVFNAGAVAANLWFVMHASFWGFGLINGVASGLCLYGAVATVRRVRRTGERTAYVSSLEHRWIDYAAQVKDLHYSLASHLGCSLSIAGPTPSIPGVFWWALDLRLPDGKMVRINTGRGPGMINGHYWSASSFDPESGPGNIAEAVRIMLGVES